MNQDDLIEAIGRQPFVPVRITLSNGKTYDVTHPDGILINKQTAAISVGESIALVSMLHVTVVIPIVTPST